MPPDLLCEPAQLELSIAHDEDRTPSGDFRSHIDDCQHCQRFKAALPSLDRKLARDATHLSPPFRSLVRRPMRDWQPVAAALLAGLVAGALMSGFGRVASVQAHELRSLYDMASPSLRGLSANLRVVERGWHPAVPERQYLGTITYSAPESLAIALSDETRYPHTDWQANNLDLRFVDGDLSIRSSLSCPVDALPDCQPPPMVRSIADLKPFDEAVLVPLEIVGPSRSLTWWSGIRVLGETEIDGREVVQVETTVSGSDLLTAITDHGAWRGLHPTDRTLIWLDRQTLVPLRIEVFAARSAERQLWAGRHGYSDERTEPLVIVEIDSLDLGGFDIEVEARTALAGGFVAAAAPILTPSLPSGFADHRQGQWLLPEGGTVWVRSWSDGRAWLMIESTQEWHEPHLFGLASPFVEPLALGGGGIAYLSADQNRIAVHSETSDVVISGSVPVETLVEAAVSLNVRGQLVPRDWDESAVVSAHQIPSGTLVPSASGWSLAGLVDGQRRVMLLVGSANQNVIIEAEPGDRLDTPTGPDFSEVEVRGASGRFDAGAGTLEWIEGGILMRMRSSSVALETLLELADSMTPR
ncbi:MAG TPA: hypothetical protein VGK83_05685 [Acidimicrobiia bacterium]